ncbi:MAG: hypothetical protein V4720_06420 [Pseudomonadota bacterium]
MNITQLYLSGNVRRWHSNPIMADTGQNLADHHGRCIQLLLHLHPSASPALIRAMAFHDVGELAAGDLSFDFKQAQPQKAAAHAEFETAAREVICGADPVLTDEEQAWLSMIDRLEAAAYVLVARPWESVRKASGWAMYFANVRRTAGDLGVGWQVDILLNDLDAGAW